MSIYSEISPKPCSSNNRSSECSLGNYSLSFKRLSLVFSAISFTLMIILLIYFTLHPSNPRFSIQQAVVYSLALSNQTLLTSNIQVTLVCKNPNQRVGVSYDKLDSYVEYKGEQITGHSSIPPFYQDHEDVNVLSSWMVANSLPVSPAFGYEMGVDQSNGKFMLKLKVIGKLRWKVGTWVMNRYDLNVQCDMFMSYNSSTNPVSLMPGSQCHTSV